VPTNADVPSTVTAFLRRVANGRVQAAAFGGAGAVSPDGSIRLTNADVLLSPAELARAAGVPRVVLVNDFGAIAEAIPRLPHESLVPCGGGVPVRARRSRSSVPAPGSGTAIGAPGRGAGSRSPAMAACRPRARG
jgi:glucokinase